MSFTNVSTWHNSSATVSCAKIGSDQKASNWILPIWIYHRFWISNKILLVKLIPAQQWIAEIGLGKMNFVGVLHWALWTILWEEEPHDNKEINRLLTSDLCQNNDCCIIWFRKRKLSQVVYALVPNYHLQQSCSLSDNKRNWRAVDLLTSMADSRLVPSQWETSLQSNAVSHWLGANLELALDICGK